MSLLVETDEVLVFAVHQLNHPAAISARRSSVHRTSSRFTSGQWRAVGEVCRISRARTCGHSHGRRHEALVSR